MNFDTTANIRINSGTRAMLWRLFIAAAFLSACAIFRVGAPAIAQNGDLDCSDFSSQQEAQNVLDQNTSDPNHLDADNDTIACEALSGDPTTSPSAQLTTSPSAQPTASSSAQPTASPSAQPTASPSAQPTATAQPQPRHEVVKPPKTGGISLEELREMREGHGNHASW